MQGRTEVATFVLLHSPLVGPLTWTLVADELHEREEDALVPHLLNDTGSSLSYWQQHGAIVAEAVRSLPPGEPVVLVGHSGAGLLLPAVAQMCGRSQAADREIAAYIFVDADLPAGESCRFDLFGSPESVDEMRQAAREGYLPVWTVEDLRDAIEDPGLRAQFVAEQNPTPVALYEEITPVFDRWPDAPCGYLHFSPHYERSLAHAKRAKWVVEELSGGHFAMLNRPVEVAQALVDMAGRLVG